MAFLISLKGVSKNSLGKLRTRTWSAVIYTSRASFPRKSYLLCCTENPVIEFRFKIVVFNCTQTVVIVKCNFKRKNTTN